MGQLFWGIYGPLRLFCVSVVFNGVYTINRKILIIQLLHLFGLRLKFINVVESIR
jgi:hypothetical protein